MDRLLIKNALIATDSELFAGDLLAENGLIADYGTALTAQDARVIDAKGKYLLPGGVDPHTHFDLDVGFDRASDDFYTGGIAAACGGTTSVIDHMAFGPKHCALTHQIGVYHELAKTCVIDYGFHGVLQHVDSGVLQDMEKLPEKGITSLKYYLTYDYRLDDADALRVMERAKELGLTLCVHCENDAILHRMREKYLAEGHTQPRFHPLSRPAWAESEAVYRSIALANTVGGVTLYIVHLSSRLGAQAAHTARHAGQSKVYLETCPQYLFLHDDLYMDDKEGLKYILAPPLRKPQDSQALWKSIQNGEIDTLGTDHCPFFFSSQKQRGKDDFTKTPNGMPGVELRLSLLFSEGFLAGKLSLPEMVRLCCTRPAEIFGIAPQKGNIQRGADADLVLFDPDISWTVHHRDLHENTDYTPYEGMQLQGKPVMTLSRGEVIVENGRFLGQKGRGRYLMRR
ncbi:dihydropyrimidinase [Ruminococcaceae bacterium OttesenSCG-928-I18]|nr:dihydropyrimidinase [Ruminococcaceae bacterium OttesenSCG-928-I18]